MTCLHKGGLAAVVLLATLGARDALANQTERVLILPFLALPPSVETLFRESDVEKVSRGQWVEKASKGVRRFVESHPELSVCGKNAEVEHARQVAGGYLKLGVDLYRNLRNDEAQKSLEKGIDVALDGFLDAFAPKLLADLYWYLGLLYVEQGRRALAHTAFRQLFAVAPPDYYGSVMFTKGYLPTTVAEIMKGALVDYWQTYPRDVPLGSPRRLSRLMNELHCKVAIFVFTEKKEGGKRLEVRVLRASSRQNLPRIESGDSYLWSSEWTNAAVLSAIDRSLWKWVACTVLPSRVRHVPERPRYYMDTGGAYLTYLKYPTRKMFHNAGFGVGLAWQILHELDYFVRLGVFTSFPDKYGDLVGNFTTVRLRTGVGYVFRNWVIRVFLHSGLELQYLSGLDATLDPNCKFFGLSSPYCSGQTSRLNMPFMGGINVSVGADVMLVSPVFLSARVGASMYFFPSGPRSMVNFPLSAELGLGYAFF